MMRMLAVAVVALLAGCGAMSPKSETVAQETFMIPSLDPGITVHVRNKYPAEKRAGGFAPERVVLFVHGATFPSEAMFDIDLPGGSWLEYAAKRGFDAYLVDIRGYGRSTRPAAMSQPPAANPPFAGADDAVRDIGAAVDFILKRRGVQKLNLMGWSWGTSTMGWYTAQHNDKVLKLVLYAPQWLRNTPSLTDSGAKLGAYRAVTREAAKGRWLTGVPESKKADLIPAGWFEAWADATFATDPVGAASAPPVLRAPNGVVADGRDFWSAGKPLYDPAEIRVPTFLAHAEWDADLPSYMLYAYFEKLVNVPYKRYVQIGEGTHTVMMEKNRMQFFRELMGFLDEEKPLALK